MVDAKNKDTQETKDQTPQKEASKDPKAKNEIEDLVSFHLKSVFRVCFFFMLGIIFSSPTRIKYSKTS